MDSRQLWFKFWSWQLLAGWPWASYLTSPWLSFLICKMKYLFPKVVLPMKRGNKYIQNRKCVEEFLAHSRDSMCNPQEKHQGVLFCTLPLGKGHPRPSGSYLLSSLFSCISPLHPKALAVFIFIFKKIFAFYVSFSWSMLPIFLLPSILGKLLFRVQELKDVFSCPALSL